MRKTGPTSPSFGRSTVLLRFRVANHRSIRDECELSLVATEDNDGTARETGLRHQGQAVAVLPVLGVFGATVEGSGRRPARPDTARTQT